MPDWAVITIIILVSIALSAIVTGVLMSQDTRLRYRQCSRCGYNAITNKELERHIVMQHPEATHSS